MPNRDSSKEEKENKEKKKGWVYGFLSFLSKPVCHKVALTTGNVSLGYRYENIWIGEKNPVT
jgi:hypothetical protein